MSTRELPGELAARPLTLGGQLLIATRDAPVQACASGHELMTVQLLSAAQLREAGVASDPRSEAPTAPATARLRVETGADLNVEWLDDDLAPSQLRCLLGSEPLPVCPAVPRVKLDYWSRLDAP
jgi:hypothetical protein